MSAPLYSFICLSVSSCQHFYGSQWYICWDGQWMQLWLDHIWVVKRKKILHSSRIVKMRSCLLTYLFSIFFHLRFWMRNLFLWKCMHLGKCCARTLRLCTSKCPCSTMTWKPEPQLSAGSVDSSGWMKISSNLSKSFSLPLFKRNICPTSISKTKTHFSILQQEAEL